MNFLVFSAFHQRPQVTELFCMNWQRIATDNPEHHFSFFAAVSDTSDIELCRKYGWGYLLVENIPVGNKFNKGLEQAIRSFDYDYVVIAGSDDLASSDLFKFITKYRFYSRQDYFGVLRAYILMPAVNEAVEFVYTIKKLCGSYRFISKKAIEACLWQVRVIAEKDFYTYKHDQSYWMSTRRAEYWCSLKWISIVTIPQPRLWHPRQNIGLDGHSESVLTSEGFYPHALNVRTSVTAVKSEVNINPYTQVSSGSLRADVSECANFLSDPEKNVLRSMGDMIGYTI